MTSRYITVRMGRLLFIDVESFFRQGCSFIPHWDWWRHDARVQCEKPLCYVRQSQRRGKATPSCYSFYKTEMVL
jgi:hypothetical protein